MYHHFDEKMDWATRWAFFFLKPHLVTLNVKDPAANDHYSLSSEN
jgi:hypothetical protein